MIAAGEVWRATIANEGARWLCGIVRPWWVAGGWALDLFVASMNAATSIGYFVETREFNVRFRMRFNLVRKAFRIWRRQAASPRVTRPDMIHLSELPNWLPKRYESRTPNVRGSFTVSRRSKLASLVYITAFLFVRLVM